MKKTNRWLALAMAGVMTFSFTACGEQAKEEEAAQTVNQEEQTPVEKATIEQLVAEGKYEEAYLAMKELEGAEAAAWQKKLVYLPLKESNATYQYNEQNRLTRREADQFVDEYEYNEQSLPIRETTTWDDDSQSITENTYDETGRLISYRNESEGEVWEYVCTYNEAGLLERIDGKSVGTEQEMTTTHTFEYDDQGKQIGNTYVDFIGRPYSIKEIYDEKGNLIRVEQIDRGKPITETYTYDEKGHVLTFSETHYEDVVLSGVYTYNEQGLRASYTETGSSYISKENYAYDEKGDCIRYEYDYESTQGEMGRHYVSTYEHVYDAYGREILCTEKRDEEWGIETTKTDYVYTPTGYTKTITTKGEGDEVSVETLEWKLCYFPEDIPEHMEFLLEEE